MCIVNYDDVTETIRKFMDRRVISPRVSNSVPLPGTASRPDATVADDTVWRIATQRIGIFFVEPPGRLSPQ
jgi:hypothetical protein